MTKAPQQLSLSNPPITISGTLPRWYDCLNVVSLMRQHIRDPLSDEEFELIRQHLRDLDTLERTTHLERERLKMVIDELLAERNPTQEEIDDAIRNLTAAVHNYRLRTTR